MKESDKYEAIGCSIWIASLLSLILGITLFVLYQKGRDINVIIVYVCGGFTFVSFLVGLLLTTISESKAKDEAYVDAIYCPKCRTRGKIYDTDDDTDFYKTGTDKTEVTIRHKEDSTYEISTKDIPSGGITMHSHTEYLECPNCGHKWFRIKTSL